MNRSNDLQAEGYELLRFPAWLVRYDPGFVAMKILEALQKAAVRARRGAA
jgi:very-short-patch-repair endonuclease